jgi:hypothetical protein
MNRTIAQVRFELRRALTAFAAAGGRGVDLAEKIDALRAELARLKAQGHA